MLNRYERFTTTNRTELGYHMRAGTSEYRGYPLLTRLKRGMFSLMPRQAESEVFSYFNGLYVIAPIEHDRLKSLVLHTQTDHSPFDPQGITEQKRRRTILTLQTQNVETLKALITPTLGEIARTTLRFSPQYASVGFRAIDDAFTLGKYKYRVGALDILNCDEPYILFGNPEKDEVDPLHDYSEWSNDVGFFMDELLQPPTIEAA